MNVQNMATKQKYRTNLQILQTVKYHAAKLTDSGKHARHLQNNYPVS